MPQKDPTAQREFAYRAVLQLREAGFQALWAGGCVRDQLLGLLPKDYDVATDARPDQIRQVFGARRTIPIGAAFGVITLLGPARSACQIDVATFRQDAGYSDGRHPDSVTFSTPQEDAQRRDFTINGLFYDPVAQEVIDYVGGREDLERRVIRAIGDPRARIAEDKLRMLRAIRFAAKFQFAIETATHDAIAAMANQVTVVSVERIAGEVRRMLEEAHRADAIVLLAEMGLLSQILPELDPASESAWQATLAALRRLPEGCFSLSLAVLVHRYLTPAQFAAVGERWKLSNREIELANWLLTHQNSLKGAAAQPWPGLQRLLIHPAREELLAFHAAVHGDDPQHAADLAFCAGKLSLPPNELNPPPLITGDDLKSLGIPPGKAYQQILEAVRDAQLEGQIETRHQALQLASSLHGS